MSIHLSEDEYKNLLQMVLIAEWVLHAHKVDDDPATAQYRELEQKVYAWAEQLGCEELVEYDEKFKSFYPACPLEEGEGMAFINDYTNDTFWSELVGRLVTRDLIEEMGEESYLQLSGEERMKKEDPLREKYIAEFERSGIGNLGTRS